MLLRFTVDAGYFLIRPCASTNAIGTVTGVRHTLFGIPEFLQNALRRTEFQLFFVAVFSRSTQCTIASNHRKQFLLGKFICFSNGCIARNRDLMLKNKLHVLGPCSYKVAQDLLTQYETSLENNEARCVCQLYAH